MTVILGVKHNLASIRRNTRRECGKWQWTDRGSMTFAIDQIQLVALSWRTTLSERYNNRRRDTDQQEANDLYTVSSECGLRRASVTDGFQRRAPPFKDESAANLRRYSHRPALSARRSPTLSGRKLFLRLFHQLAAGSGHVSAAATSHKCRDSLLQKISVKT